jgi:hypothetical protein
MTKKMTPAYRDFAEIDSCHCLFLREITLPKENALRLLLEEAFVMRDEVTVSVGRTEIMGGHPVRAIEGSRLFEIIWDLYVAYSVRNESYVTRDESEEFSGRFARIYSKSHFLDYVSHATFCLQRTPRTLAAYRIGVRMPHRRPGFTEPPRVRQVRSRAAVQ